MRDPRLSSMNLVVCPDASSWCVVGARLFERVSSENAVIALREAIAAFGKPASVLSDNGACFVDRVGRKGASGKRYKPTAPERSWSAAA